MSIHRILIVDDDPLSREYLVEACKSLGLQTNQATNGREAMALIEQSTPDLVITDLRMPEMTGTELIESLAQNWPELPTVLVTAHGSVEAAVQAMRLGASDFLLKPCSVEALEMVIERIDRTHRLQRENQYLRSELVGAGEEDPAAGIIAESPGMLDTLRTASRIARSKGTVLITGESGTGKERVAQFIHKSSPRANGPFIRVNCAALSEQLLESELFGHERGSFTGAHKTREGRFELADGGTLLLDEIGEISPALQAKLLRVLEEEEFERVGGNTTLSVDVRVIATTNRDLQQEMSEGNFREDLYYRLHVLPIQIHSLRDRPEDIEPMAYFFAKSYARQNGQDAPRIERDAIDRLLSWRWPGNVRELENVVQRAVVLSKDNVITEDELLFGPGQVSNEGPSAPFPSPHEAGETTLAPFLANRAMSDIERVAILATLDSTRGNKTEAARRLGLTARTLSNKLKLWRQAGLVA